MNKLNWTVFVSQSGKEVYDICQQVGIVPKLLITNNRKKLREDVVSFLEREGCELRSIPFRPNILDYFQEDILSSTIITLHGYLRILPGRFIETYGKPIYNGHPGLITHNEELKGKDPQIRAWEGKYDTVGSVVHLVTEGVDEGRVTYFTAVENVTNSLDEMYELLRQTSLVTWVKFFKENLLVNQKENLIL